MKTSNVNDIKKKFVLVLIVVCLLYVANSFLRMQLLDRAVVIGLGIDYQQADNTFKVTAEVISPNKDNDENTKKQSKLLSGKGKTIPLAIQNIYQTTGKNPSLGQTGLILLGESTKQINLKEHLSYFVFSNAFKEGATVLMCKGSANKVLKSNFLLDGMVSFALPKIIKESGKKTNYTGNTLQHFVEKQMTLSNTTFLREVEFLGDNEGGVFDCSQVSVYKDGIYKDILTKEQTRGFVFLSENMTYDYFTVDNQSIGISSKKLKKQVEFKDNVPVVTFVANVQLRKMKTDITGHVVEFLPQKASDIDEETKEQVKMKIEQIADLAIQKSKECDCDFFEVANNMYRKYGNIWKNYQKTNVDYLAKTIFKIEIEIHD